VSRDEALGRHPPLLEICCRRAFPEWTVPALAWPNGNARDDLGDDLEAMGLRAALGTRRGAAGTPDEARWNLPRNNVDRQLAFAGAVAAALAAAAGEVRPQIGDLGCRRARKQGGRGGAGIFNNQYSIFNISGERS
jgi:hypothetical protein